MQQKTVAQVAVEILTTAKTPLTLVEITQMILDQKLYEFNSKDPKGIVRGAIERRCDGLNRKDSINPKYFKKLSDGKYELREVALQ
jgi:HB1, ASXL, restriction endonuclease HTH domain